METKTLHDLKEERTFLIQEFRVRADPNTHIELSPYNLELISEIQKINEQIYNLLVKTV